jgi:hypothetical protein
MVEEELEGRGWKPKFAAIEPRLIGRFRYVKQDLSSKPVESVPVIMLFLGVSG